MAGEFDFIEWLRAQRHGAGERVLIPPGDDLAALAWDGNDLLLVGVDQVLDGVHFDSAVHSPRQIGAKVVKRNLSDCAAMGCLPAGAVVAAALPRGVGIEYAKELYLGMREAADPFDCPIVGGDTGSWEGRLALSLTILGRSAGVTPVTRAGAKPGQQIYVTGALGGSILGRHMSFAPRVNEGRRLAGFVSAMIDLSDGLSRDLGHICRESGVGAVVVAEQVPVHADAVELGRRDGRGALEHALHDGEDYELLFVADGPPPADVPAIHVGWTTADRAVVLRTSEGDVPLGAKGWEHGL